MSQTLVIPVAMALCLRDGLESQLTRAVSNLHSALGQVPCGQTAYQEPRKQAH